MIDTFVRAPGKGWESAQVGIDQAVHNFLVHDRMLSELNVYDNDGGPVLTVGIEDNVLVDANGFIVNKRGDVPNVVHQYDRHWQLAKRFCGYRYLASRAFSSLLRKYGPRVHRAFTLYK
jgi:hypothetical protein